MAESSKLAQTAILRHLLQLIAEIPTVELLRMLNWELIADQYESHRTYLSDHIALSAGVQPSDITRLLRREL